ncbi:ATP-binding protein [Bilophila sp.]|uniref:ATP-binding protein n=1 Tax=Bilophila sp. TaxID=1929485 RepID=UPI00307814AB
MRIAIASGKGGAGKTTVTASLASVWARPFVAVDTDVEAPNLHLFLPPAVEESETVGLEVPVLDPERCTLCGACRTICRYKAIAQFASRLTIFTDMCHGCGGCFAVCPSQALTPGSRELGALEQGTVLEGRGRFLMGRSRIGEAMTPPLLRALRKKLDLMLTAIPADALIDSPPGVSCPAMTVGLDADAVLLVAEPTPFGFHDFRLAHQAFRQIGKPVAVIMNRAAMPGNAEGDGALRAYCAERGLPLLGELPFDRAAAETYAKGRLIAAASPEWRARFESLRDTVLTFAEGACHA